MNTSVTTSGNPWDVIDDLHRRCGGEALRITDRVTGETDYLRRRIDGRDVQRLAAAGLVSRTRGLAADQLAEVYGWSGTPADFIEHYLDECMRGLDLRAARRRRVAWEDQQRPEWSYDDADQ